MTTTLFYGVTMAIANTVLNYVLYFLGFHDSPEKLGTAQTIGGIGGLVISVTCLVLSIRARRDETPVSEDFGYGRAFLAGFLTSLWSTIIGTISQVVYVGLVNPNFREVMVQSELAKAEAKGATAAQLEGAEKIIRMMSGPVAQGIVAFIFGLVILTLISLVVAAFFRRRGTGDMQAV